VVTGIRLHRRIDSYVDCHPAFRTSRARVSAPRRRFAGILVDLFYDHFLSRDWARHADEPLPGFCQRAYRAFDRHAELLPPLARRIAAAMAAGDWLAGYGRLAGIEHALRGVDRRLSRPGPLAGGLVELQRDYSGYAADFELLLPDLRALAARELGRGPDRD
jgi:acyl carrier protein phosphodiesterase